MKNEKENMNTDVTKEFENSKFTNSLSSFNEYCFQPKKVIAKLKITRSKKYKKQVLYISSQIPHQFTLKHKFLIFGSIEIETFYKDFTSMYDNDLIMISSFNTKILQVERKNKEQCIQVNMENIGNSGLKDFQFLINHFQKFPDQNYQYLAQQLQQYQNLTNECVKYLTDINKKVISRIINEEELLKAHQDYEQYFQNYIKQNYKDSDFYTCGIVYFDHETQDVYQKYTCFSLSLLSLLGLEPDEIEQKFLHSNISFSWLLGKQRLQSAIRSLFIFNNNVNKFSYEQTIITVDYLEFVAKMNVEIVQWQNFPEWIGQYHMLGLVCKVDVSLNQLKSIIEMRSNQDTEKVSMFGQNLEQLFEYTVQSEIFLEKFYPDLFKNYQTKRSLTLKQPNLQVIKEEQQIIHTNSNQ